MPKKGFNLGGFAEGMAAGARLASSTRRDIEDGLSRRQTAVKEKPAKPSPKLESTSTATEAATALRRGGRVKGRR